MNQRVVNLLLGAGFIAFAGFIVLEAQDFDPPAARLPLVLATAFAVFGGILLVGNAIPSGRTVADERPFSEVPWRVWLSAVAALMTFALLSARIGMYEAGFLFMLGLAIVLTRGQSWTKRLALSGVFAVICTVFLYVMFDTVLRVPTPDGLLL